MRNSCANELFNEFGGVSKVTWLGIKEKINTGSNVVKFADYTLGWALVYSASSVLANKRTMEAGFGDLLLQLHRKAIPGELLGTFDRLFSDGIIPEDDFNRALQNRLERSLLD